MVGLAATEQAIEDAAEISEVAADYFVHQISFRSIDRSRNLKGNGVVTGIARWFEIIADCAKQLAPDFLINGELRFQLHLSSKSNRSGGGQSNVRRMKKQLI